MKTLDKKQQIKKPVQASSLGRHVNLIVDKHRHTERLTFNEDEESWLNRQNEDYTNEYHYDDEQRDAGDYIHCDRSDYNRGDCRLGWFEPEDF